MTKKTEQSYKSSEDYKNAVRAYLLNKLGTSEQVAEDLVKENSAALEGYLEDKFPVSATATGIARGLL